MEISKKEKLKLFKVAEEQIQTRIFNKTGHRKAIIETFNTLDIEVICPEFIKEKKQKAKKTRDKIARAGTDILEQIKLKRMLKEDKTLETWAIADEAGYIEELKKLREEYTKGRTKKWWRLPKTIR